MKKIILFFICILFVATQAKAVYELTDNTAYTKQFNLRMCFCAPIDQIQPFDDGSKIIRRIIGFQDHVCKFSIEKYDKDGNMTEKTSCSLAQPQRAEFVNAAKNDMDGIGAAKDYIERISQDENICKVEKFVDDEEN